MGDGVVHRARTLAIILGTIAGVILLLTLAILYKNRRPTSKPRQQDDTLRIHVERSTSIDYPEQQVNFETSRLSSSECLPLSKLIAKVLILFLVLGPIRDTLQRSLPRRHRTSMVLPIHEPPSALLRNSQQRVSHERSVSPHTPSSRTPIVPLRQVPGATVLSTPPGFISQREETDESSVASVIIQSPRSRGFPLSPPPAYSLLSPRSTQTTTFLRRDTLPSYSYCAI
jgi:hypothetical protein